MNGVEAFRSAMLAHGLEPPKVIEPGVFCRFSSNGKPGDDAAWCKLFEDGTGGAFGDWRSGLNEVWQAHRERPFSQAERAEFMRRCEEARREREREEARRHAEARERAQAVWSQARPAPADNPYLARKCVKPTGTLREIPALGLAEILEYTPKSRGEPLAGHVLLAP